MKIGVIFTQDRYGMEATKQEICDVVKRQYIIEGGKEIPISDAVVCIMTRPVRR